MKQILLFSVIVFAFASCQSEHPKNQELNTTEESAVEAQVNKDQAAMDSLEKAIEAQISATDSL